MAILMKTLYMTFKVKVGNDRGQCGEAEMKIKLLRSTLEDFNPGTLLTGLLSSALADYDTADKEVAGKEEIEPVPF